MRWTKNIALGIKAHYEDYDDVHMEFEMHEDCGYSDRAQNTFRFFASVAICTKDESIGISMLSNNASKLETWVDGQYQKYKAIYSQT